MSIFQQIVDTYGTPNYKELNPAVPAIVSFPFLFGVMFGDIMHGAILTVFGLYACIWRFQEGSLLDRSRYLLLMMGFFATYCGFIYNDFSSLPVMITESCWALPGKSEIEAARKSTRPLVTAHRPDKDCVYPFGLDYTWMRSQEEIQYLNSFKMKTAVLFGVAQMLLGTSMRIANQIYHKQYLDLVFIGITQFVMLTALFGFMDYLIVGKWLTDWDMENDDNNKQPPGVILTMITMFLKGGVYD